MSIDKIPLAERVRPTALEDFIGQERLVGEEGIIRKAVLAGAVPSMILWGPPGVGKTTLAFLISRYVKAEFYTLSAISSGVKDVRNVIEKAKMHGRTILFIDEIHRFSKSQQDALLGAVEKGIVTLIGATTENPSFEVISALLSRCQVYTLEPLSEDDLKELMHAAIKKDDRMSRRNIEFSSYRALLNLSGGDARKLLNLLELTVDAIPEGETVKITDELVMDVAQQRVVLYDKSGEQHYDIISAFIKSMRGSDPNGAVYWLARMIEGGEDVKFIARRMVIFASEDVGNANPTALALATSCFQAVNMIGYPEAEIILGQCVVYLASSPKSNASYAAIKKAKAVVRETGDLPVPMHIRNAPTQFMKQEGYGKGYKYAHDYDHNFVAQEYLPGELSGKTFYEPGRNAREEEFRKRLRNFWGKKYGY